MVLNGLKQFKFDILVLNGFSLQLCHTFVCTTLYVCGECGEPLNIPYGFLFWLFSSLHISFLI